MRLRVYLPVLAFAACVLTGCPKANQNFDAGRKAEAIQDYDTALVEYDRALRADPSNAEYKLRSLRMHEMDGNFHLEQGEKLLKKGEGEMALAEFEKAQGVDPSNMAAEQEMARVSELLAKKNQGNGPEQANIKPPQEQFLSAPP